MVQTKLSKRKRDQQLLNLQKRYTKKIAEITDEKLIRCYLRKTWEVAQKRLALRKTEN